MKKILFLASVAVMMLGATSCQKSSTTQTTFKTNEELEAVDVKVKTVSSRDVDQLVEFTANVQSDVVNKIAPQAPTRIRKINVEVGTRVAAGQILVVLDNNNQTQLQAQLSNLEAEFNRMDVLYQAGGVSKSQWEQVKTQLDVMRQSMKNVEENTVLRSPISGVVTARNYDNGDLYSGAQPVLVVEKLTPVKILLDVNEQYYRDVKVGMPVDHITLDAYPGEEFQGKVSIIYPTLNTMNRTFQIEVTIPNANQRVRPGMFARVALNFGSQHHVLVPDQAIVKQTGSGERFVYVVNDGRAYHRTVELGRRIDAEYEIIDGLQDGDVVVVFGHNLLNDGRQVNVL